VGKLATLSIEAVIWVLVVRVAEGLLVVLSYMLLLLKLVFPVSKGTVHTEGAWLSSNIELAQLSFDLQLVISCFLIFIVVLLVYVVHLDGH